MATPELDLAHLARLARLSLEPAELATLGDDLRRILAYVDELAQLDLTGVPPMVHPLPFEATPRPDVAEPPLAREVALAGSARHDGESFIVPRVL